MPTPRCSTAGWRTRIELLLKRDERGGDLLGQPGNSLFGTWWLSREKFRVANDWEAYIKVEFVSWYPATNADSKWERARAATSWETHVALLQRLRSQVRNTVQRLALTSLRSKQRLTAGVVSKVAAFLLMDESEVSQLYCSLAGRRRLVRICNKKMAGKKGMGEEEKNVMNAEGPQNGPINPPSMGKKRVVRLVNKKLPWPSC